MTGDGVEFRLLGSVRASDRGRPVDLGVRKQRFVLAVLLLEINKLVPTERLVELTWPAGAGPGPDQPRRAIHMHVSRLRKALAGAGDVALVGEPAGYLLRADAGRVDAHRFRSLLAAATAEPDDRRRVRLLDTALDLWEGPALASVTDEDTRARLAYGLEEARLTAVEERLDAHLRLGRHHAVVDELVTLAARHPHRQRLTGQLMLALHRGGRTAEALTVFADAARRSADETGLAPSAELTRLQLAILRDDPALHLPTTGTASPAPTATPATRATDPPDRTAPPPRTDAAPPSRTGTDPQPGGGQPTGTDGPSAGARTTAETAPPSRRGAGHPVGAAPSADADAETARRGTEPAGPPPPRQLPALVTAFTGRDDELQRLAGTATVAVHTITGMAGVGKTTLAVRVAHRLADRYPDGQVFLDLHGFTHGMAPTDPDDALDHLLRALGVPGERVPADTEQRAALLRSTLAGRRVLVVLDNAASEEQVRPLLPGAAGCLVLVTSRYPLTGLDEARPVALDMPPPGDAAALFERVVGRRLPADMLAEVVGLCGRLPLALRLAAARLRDNPKDTLGGLAERLRDERRRLAELEVGQRGVAATFALSYRQVPAGQRRLFRLLGLHPGTDVDAYAAAALAGAEPADAGRMLDALARANLLTAGDDGRYHLHDLLRGYAAEVADQEEPAAERHEALARLRAMYLYTAARAMDLFLPAEAYIRPAVDAPATAVPPLADYPAALAWLDTECANLLATAGRAPDPDHLDVLTRTVAKYLTFRSRYQEEHALLSRLLAAAHRLGRRDTEAYARTTLGTVCRRTGRFAEAADHLSAAIVIARETGNRVGETRVLRQLGLVLDHLGRPADAVAHLRQALDLCREIGDRHDEGYTLLYLAHCCRKAGRPTEAIEHLREAFGPYRDSGEDDSFLRIELGLAHLSLGEHGDALRYHEQVLAVALRTEDRALEFEARHGLGLVMHAMGRLNEARTHQRDALTLATDLRQPGDQSRARHALTRLAGAT